MEPRKALITSAAVAATLVSASAAMALNGGILDTGGNDGVGTLNPTMVTAEETTRIDLPDAVTVTPSDGPAVTTSSASTVTDASTYQSDDSYESDDEYDDSYESDDRDESDDEYDDSYESDDEDDSYESDDRDESDDEYDDDRHEYEGYDHDD